MNTKTLLGVLMLIGLFLSVVGCSTTPADTTPPANEGPAANEPPEEEPIEPELEETRLSQEIRDVLAKSENIGYYQYTYQSTESAKYTANYYVKGSKIKIHYGLLQRYNNFAYFDVYLDRAKGLAYLVCDDNSYCKGLWIKEVMFDEFNVETPLDAVAHIDNGEKIEDSEWDSKKAIVVLYVNNAGNSEKVWLWTYRGLPLKREITSGGIKTTITYNSLVVNTPEEVSVEVPEGLEMV